MRVCVCCRSVISFNCIRHCEVKSDAHKSALLAEGSWVRGWCLLKVWDHSSLLATTSCDRPWKQPKCQWSTNHYQFTVCLCGVCVRLPKQAGQCQQHSENTRGLKMEGQNHSLKQKNSCWSTAVLVFPSFSDLCCCCGWAPLLQRQQDSVTLSLKCSWWKTGMKEALVVVLTV